MAQEYDRAPDIPLFDHHGSFESGVWLDACFGRGAGLKHDQEG